MIMPKIKAKVKKVITNVKKVKKETKDTKTPTNKISKPIKINAKLVAAEILEWLSDNAAYYVDNEEKVFSVNITVDQIKYPETYKLYMAYKSIPRNEEELVTIEMAKEIQETGNLNLAYDTPEIKKNANIIIKLDKITNDVFAEIKKNKAGNKKLLKSLMFFFECNKISFTNKMEGMHKSDVEPKGSVAITTFEYDTFGFPVTAYFAPTPENPEKTIISQGVVEEGFHAIVELDI